jgi:hypothetical protein
MSFAITAVVGTAATVGASVYSANKASKTAKAAIASQEQQADEALVQQQSSDAQQLEIAKQQLAQQQEAHTQQLEASRLALGEQQRATDAMILQYREQSALATKQAEENRNRLNAKLPDTAKLRSSNRQGANAGIGSTMLTSAKGVDPGSLKLGKNTLLGQ